MPEQKNNIEDRVAKTLRRIHDPEIPVNIYDLGLIYELDVSDAGHAHIKMTLTSPGCPVAGMILDQVKQQVEALDDIETAEVELVWDPPWSPDRMSEAARLELNIEPGQAPPHRPGPQFFDINRPK